MSILYTTTRFANTFTRDKEKNIRVQLLSWGKGSTLRMHSNVPEKTLFLLIASLTNYCRDWELHTAS